MEIVAGDIIIIPAGVGQKCLSASSDFMVVGAYPNGAAPDLIKEHRNEHNSFIENIKKVSLPSTGPLQGKTNGIRSLWK